MLRINAYDPELLTFLDLRREVSTVPTRLGQGFMSIRQGTNSKLGEFQNLMGGYTDGK
jgi:hypothetical protein